MSFPLRWDGVARADAAAEGARVTAEGPTALRGLGLEFELGEGDSLFVEGLRVPDTPQNSTPIAEPAAPVVAEEAVELEGDTEPEATPTVDPESVRVGERAPVEGGDSQGGGS